jgi:hypothetical protein
MKQILVVLLLAAILITVSLFLPVRINNHEQQSEVHLGLPLSFVIQDQTNYDPPFPHTTRFVSPWESVTNLDLLNLIISFLVVCVVLETGWYMILLIRKLTAHKNAKE